MIPDRIMGKAYVVGNNIDTDVIIPGRYLTTMDPSLLAAHVMEDLDPSRYPIPFLNPDKSCDYKIIVAGRNFGCGSSREHAPIAFYAAGIRAVVAKSFARIFYRNCVNGGKPLPLESREDLSLITKTGQELEIILGEEIIVDLTTGTKHRFKPFDPLAKEILEAGGLTAYNKRKLGL